MLQDLLIKLTEGIDDDTCEENVPSPKGVVYQCEGDTSNEVGKDGDGNFFQDEKGETYIEVQEGKMKVTSEPNGNMTTEGDHQDILENMGNVVQNLFNANFGGVFSKGEQDKTGTNLDRSMVGNYLLKENGLELDGKTGGEKVVNGGNGINIHEIGAILHDKSLKPLFMNPIKNVSYIQNLEDDDVGVDYLMMVSSRIFRFLQFIY